MYYPPSPPSQPLYQPPFQPTPRRGLPSFWRGVLIALAVGVPVLCLVSGIGLTIGVRTGALVLPNGMSVPVVSGSRPDGYLYNVLGSAAIFITFDEAPHDGANTGSLVEAYVQDGLYSHQNGVWTGTESGSDLVMQFGGATWRGTWQGANLKVVYPTISGYINTGLFVPASVADYNNAAFALQQSTQ